MITHEKLESHYNVVKAKHDALDKMIEDAYNHYVDSVEVVKLKLEKLHLKEEMERIQTQMKAH